MINPSEIPSLSAYLDSKLDVEVVPGQVTSQDNHFYYTFSIISEDVASMTAQEMFLLYLKPVLDGFANRINELGPVCTKALRLPGKGEKIVGFRCWKGKIPVNLYICRRANPDRHQYIIDMIVQPKGEEDGEA